MKPVNKGASPQRFSSHGLAKPFLIEKIGGYCSYCEAVGAPQELDVEHIYPKDPHPEKKTKWENFLVSCTTCNSYKNIYLGSGRRRGLEKRYLWPHLDNTCRAYRYFSDGRIEVKSHLRGNIKKAALATREMVGLLLSPAKAKKYHQLGIAYDGIKKRSEKWGAIERLRTMYLFSSDPAKTDTLAETAAVIGYFSIWMEVFHDRPEVREALIAKFKADPDCFNAATQPIKKGRV